jgi:exosortase/archaeosortase family protein
MFAALKQNRFLRFILISALSYFLLYLLHEFVIKRYTFWDQIFIGYIINSADVVLHLLGFSTFKQLSLHDFQVIGIDGSEGVWIGAACNAITLFFLFGVFIVAYPGHQKSKWWFVPMGIITIHILNILRVCALAWIARYHSQYLDFNHTYTFTFIVYCYIFFLWMIWVNKYSTRTDDAKK